MRTFLYLTALVAILAPSTTAFTRLRGDHSSSSSSVKIRTSGYKTIKRPADIVDLYMRIHDESSDADDVLAKVRAASEEFATIMRTLAPPKAEVTGVDIDDEALDIDDEKLDPAFPVTSWNMRQLRTWHEVDYKHSASRLVLMDPSSGEVSPKDHPKIFHAEVQARAAFHDFTKLSDIIAQLTTNCSLTVQSICWDVARPTRAALQKRVTQGAYAAALARAADYADAISPGSTPRPIEVYDRAYSDEEGNCGWRRHEYVRGYDNDFGVMGGGRGETKSLNLEPELIMIKASTDIHFALDI